LGKLPAIRLGHLRILDHLMIGLASEESSGALLKQTPSLMSAVPMGSWQKLRQSFCDGDLHGAFLPLPEAMHLFDSGMDIKIILLDGRPCAPVVASSSAKVDTLSDLKGKTVLLSNYLSVHHLLLYRLMASTGLRAGTETDPHADVHIEIVPPSMVAEMFLHDDSGEIGGSFIEEPYGSLLIGKGLGKIICPSSRLWPDHPGSVLVVHDYVISDHRPYLMEIVNLLVASNSFAYRSSDELHRFSLEKFFDQDSQVVDQILSNFLPERPRSLVPEIHYIEIINQFMVKEMGIMKNIIDIDDLVDRSFALEAGIEKN